MNAEPLNAAVLAPERVNSTRKILFQFEGCGFHDQKKAIYNHNRIGPLYNFTYNECVHAQLQSGLIKKSKIDPSHAIAVAM